jgi:hypothetical protein
MTFSKSRIVAGGHLGFSGCTIFWPFGRISIGYGFHPVKFERPSSSGSQVTAFAKSKMAAGRHLGFNIFKISSPQDALPLAWASIWQNFKILAQTVQKLWVSENPKWRPAAILDFDVVRHPAIPIDSRRLRLPSCEI